MIKVYGRSPSASSYSKPSPSWDSIGTIIQRPSMVDTSFCKPSSCDPRLQANFTAILVAKIILKANICVSESLNAGQSGSHRWATVEATAAALESRRMALAYRLKFYSIGEAATMRRWVTASATAGWLSCGCPWKGDSFSTDCLYAPVWGCVRLLTNFLGGF